jgi:pimeloyl-ACP methyl ester carboxylesterase
MNSFYSQQAGCTVRWHDLPGSGDPVVFIHGLGCASSYEYPRVVRDPLFGARRAILIDLPGSGYSDKPEHYSYKTTDQAHVVAELIDHLKLDAFWLYGHSMGGSIAIETAGLLASRVKGLMVSEPNFHAGGGMFSRSIAAQTEQQFLSRVMTPCSAQKKRRGQGACRAMRLMPSGAAHRAWWRALNRNGKRSSCHFLAR